MDSHHAQQLDPEVWNAARGYKGPTLMLYDAGVYGFWNPYIWKCPTELLLKHYKAHVRPVHLEAGCGTGYLPDHAGLPRSTDGAGHSTAQLTLIDLSPGSLAWSARRLASYQPSTLLHNLFEPLPTVSRPYDSISLNYVLHCVPGSFDEKARILHNLKAVLAPDGVLVGSTILGLKEKHTPLARLTLKFFYQIKSFHNEDDTLADLEKALRSCFKYVSCRAVGSVALFAASDVPLPPPVS